MKSSLGTEALIALEDAKPDFVFETFPDSGILVWPLLRGLITVSTAEAELSTYPIEPEWSNAALLTRAARALLPNRAASSRMHTRTDALFVVHGGTYVQTAKGRRNWMIEDHADAIADRAAVLQILPIDPLTPHEERPTFVPTSTFEDAVFRTEVARRFSPPSDAAVRLARQITKEAYARLDFPVDDQRIAKSERQLVTRFARARFTVRYFSRVLDRVQPRIVFMQTASYGDRSHLIGLLKDRGVYVAEHQHGWIGPSHGAYNFGAAMSTPELRRTLPDALLTYGDFWSESVRFPGEKAAIGKPHLERTVAELEQPGSERHRLLVVSSAAHRDEMTRTTTTLRDALPPTWQVLFRPHPSERGSVDALYPGLVGEDRISFDLTPDVYTTFAGVSGVFGTASTVLYEALAFGSAVFVVDSPLTELYIDASLFGEPVRSDADLQQAAGRIVSGDGDGAGLSERQLARVWKPNSVQNFVDFYRTVVPS